VKRDWKQARAKCDGEGECRVCGAPHPEAAHSVGRAHDPPSGKVRPQDIIPLCGKCHREYDGRRLSILAHVTYDEQAAAVEHLGLLRALQRLDPPGT
jgi:hypothetical protein